MHGVPGTVLVRLVFDLRRKPLRLSLIGDTGIDFEAVFFDSTREDSERGNAGSLPSRVSFFRLRLLRSHDFTVLRRRDFVAGCKPISGVSGVSGTLRFFRTRASENMDNCTKVPWDSKPRQASMTQKRRHHTQVSYKQKQVRLLPHNKHLSSTVFDIMQGFQYVSTASLSTTNYTSR